MSVIFLFIFYWSCVFYVPFPLLFLPHFESLESILSFRVHLLVNQVLLFSCWSKELSIHHWCIFILCVYLAASCLSCGAWSLCCVMQGLLFHCEGSLVVTWGLGCSEACGLLVPTARQFLATTMPGKSYPWQFIVSIILLNGLSWWLRW